MTEKQKAILNKALELFSAKGFDAVSTNQIAREAGVSEGLIFRHFKNKIGLLEAIMAMGQEKVQPYISIIELIQDPQQRIQTILELPFHIPESDYPLWRLIYALKWQKEIYETEMVQPMKSLLVSALTTLGYPNSDIEADLILAYLDGLATTLLLKGNEVDKDKLLKVLRKKYK